VRFLYIILTIYGINSFASTWEESWISGANHNNKNNIANLLKILKTSETGQKIITLAKNKYKKNIFDLIKVGNVSLTDTSLKRSFYPGSSDIDYEEISTVVINKNLNLRDAVLDLSHELTHFTFRKVFNPYQNNFKIKDYIKRTIEGRGGEADAFIVECRVRKELFGEDSLNENQCGKIIIGNDFSRKRVVSLFYQMGKFYSKFIDFTNSENYNYQLANSKNIHFISSAFNLPYPLAAAMEFINIKDKICRTNKMRIQSFKKELRKPASVTKRSPSSSVVSQLENNFSKYCL